MAEFSDEIKNLKPPQEVEAQREAIAIYALAIEQSESRSPAGPTGGQLEFASQYLDRLRKGNPDDAEQIVQEMNAIEDLKKDAGTELYELWVNTRQKIIKEMSKQHIKAMQEIESVIELGRKIPSDILTDYDKRNVKETILQINKNLNIQIIIRMKLDETIDKAFRGKEQLLEKFVAFQKTQPTYIAEKYIRY